MEYRVSGRNRDGHIIIEVRNRPEDAESVRDQMIRDGYATVRILLENGEEYVSDA